MEWAIRLQSTATVMTIGVSLLFLVRLWREAALSDRQLLVFGVWFVVALAVQLGAHGAGAWIAGLVAQFALAVVLVLKDQIGNVF